MNTEQHWLYVVLNTRDDEVVAVTSKKAFLLSTSTVLLQLFKQVVSVHYLVIEVFAEPASVMAKKTTDL